MSYPPRRFSLRRSNSSWPNVNDSRSQMRNESVRHAPRGETAPHQVYPAPPPGDMDMSPRFGHAGTETDFPEDEDPVQIHEFGHQYPSHSNVSDPEPYSNERSERYLAHGQDEHMVQFPESRPASAFRHPHMMSNQHRVFPPHGQNISSDSDAHYGFENGFENDPNNSSDYSSDPIMLGGRRHSSTVTFQDPQKQMNEEETKAFYMQDPEADHAHACPGCNGSGVCPHCQAPPPVLSRKASDQLMVQGINYCFQCRNHTNKCSCSSFPQADPPLFPDVTPARCFDKGHGCQHCGHCRSLHGGRRKADVLAPTNKVCRMCGPHNCNGCGRSNLEHDETKQFYLEGNALSKLQLNAFLNAKRNPLAPSTPYKPTTCIRCKKG